MALLLKISRLIIIGCITIQICAAFAIFTQPTLYTDKDHITLLNATNFKETIHGRTTAWVVEFYNSWCGHCVRFAPEWIKLAQDVKAWNSIIGIAAIDCAVEENVKTCQKYLVSAFPTIKFFKSNSTDDDVGKAYTDKKEIETIRHAMIDFLTLNNPHPPSSWPDLHPIRYLDMDSLWKDAPSGINYTAIVGEPENSYLGREVILDAMPLSKHIRVLRAIKDRAPLMENFKDMPLRFMVITSRAGELKTYVDVDDSRSGYVQYLEEFAKEKLKWKPDEDGNEIINNIALASHDKQRENDTSAVINVFSEMDRVFLQDIENALHYMFYQEVLLKETISGDKLTAFEAFVAVLAKYLPGKEKTKSFLNKLNEWVAKQPFIPTDVLKEKLEEIQSSLSFQLKMNEWAGCKGSLPYLRGYPCGLWVTFHTLTVSAYHLNSKDPDFNPLEVLMAIRGYVMNFFSCKTCVEHFTNMSSHIAEEVNSPEDTVLWLWQAHNKVNMRLKGDETEDLAHPKVQFPSDAICSNCRSSGDGAGSQWDLTAVLDFLLSHYSAEEIMATEDITKWIVKEDTENASASPPKVALREDEDTIEKRDIHKKPMGLEIEKDMSNVQSSIFSKWGFGSTDISLCILLYISSILLLLVCYCYILTRRRSLLNILKRRALHFFV